VDSIIESNETLIENTNQLQNAILNTSSNLELYLVKYKVPQSKTQNTIVIIKIID
jgi:hypothetical protein